MRVFSLDLRHSLRAFLKDRLFTAVAILTFAAGIGAATAVFTVFSAAFLRPPPFPNAPRMAFLEPRWIGAGSHEVNVIAASDYMEFRRRARSFRQLAALEGAGPEVVGQYVARTPAGSVFLASGNVTWNFFEAFGVRPLVGRAFEPRDEQTPRPAVVILSERTWRTRFASNPAAVGRIIELDGMPLEVAGVMPASFEFPPKADIWIPFSAAAFARAPRSAVQPVGMLADGATLASAQAELASIAGELSASYPATNSGRGIRALSLREALSGDLRKPLTVLLVSTLLLLLIASVNVANLQLARASSRGREFAIRAALGAGQARIARQLLVETLALACAGGLLGAGFAAAAVRVLGSWAPAGSQSMGSTALDWRVVLATFALVLMAAAVSGLVPALLTSRVSLAAAMRDGSAAAGSRTAARRWLATSEIALATVLLVCAGLSIESFRRLNAVEHGFRDPAGATAMLLTFPPATYPTSASRRLAQAEILRRVRQLPAVESAGFTYRLPLQPVTLTGLFRFDGRGADDALTTDIQWVTPDALEALGVPLLRGRAFRAEDGTTPPARVILVNHEFMRRYLKAGEPVGARIVFVPGEGADEVAGVVGNVRHRSLDRAVAPTVYKPAWTMPWCYLVVRRTQARAAPGAAIAREISAAASDQPISAMPALSTLLEESISPQRYRTRLIAAFGGLALLLAAIGIYGVVAYSMSQRTREIAVRIAIGAGRRNVVGMVLREGAGLALTGIAVGWVLARAAAQAISTLLFEVSPGEPLTYVGTAALLVAVVILACLAPARRACRLDPILVLREV